MKQQQHKIERVKNPFSNLDKKDFDKIVRASNNLIAVINGQKKKEIERQKTDEELKQFMEESDAKMRKRFEEIIERIERIGAKQKDKTILMELETVKKSLRDIMSDMMYIIL